MRNKSEIRHSKLFEITKTDFFLVIYQSYLSI